MAHRATVAALLSVMFVNGTQPPTCQPTGYPTPIANLCEGLGYCNYWDHISVPFDKRNNVGRAVYQTNTKAKKAAKLIKKGIQYDLAHDSYAGMPILPGRFWETHPICEHASFFPFNFHGGCQTFVNTDSLGNVGTQFDALGHIWAFDDNLHPDLNVTHAVFFNGFTGGDILEPSVVAPTNMKYLGIEHLPSFFARGILVDVAHFLGKDVLDDNFFIKTDVFESALQAQAGLHLHQLEEGDVIMIRTGWSKWYTSGLKFFDLAAPGVHKSLVDEVLFPKGIMIVGSDNWAVDGWDLSGVFPENWGILHRKFLLCGGGFLHEAMFLDDWAADAALGHVPYIGAYSFTPEKLRGGVASPGRPIVFV